MRAVYDELVETDYPLTSRQVASIMGRNNRGGERWAHAVLERLKRNGYIRRMNGRPARWGW